MPDIYHPPPISFEENITNFSYMVMMHSGTTTATCMLLLTPMLTLVLNEQPNFTLYFRFGHVELSQSFTSDTIWDYRKNRFRDDVTIALMKPLCNLVKWWQIENQDCFDHDDVSQFFVMINQLNFVAASQSARYGCCFYWMLVRRFAIAPLFIVDCCFCYSRD